MSFSHKCNTIFDRCVEEYHVYESTGREGRNPFSEGIERLLYNKCLVDVVQWHLEDLIRNPDIIPADALAIKQRIDRSNQERVNLVEDIDGYFLEKFKEVVPKQDATTNTESPGLAIDRLSILAIKIYHMRFEAGREDSSPEHRRMCAEKLAILAEQREDLSLSIDRLLLDISNGDKRMKVYRQMKMYNDADTNPVLYATQK